MKWGKKNALRRRDRELKKPSWRLQKHFERKELSTADWTRYSETDQTAYVLWKAGNVGKMVTISNSDGCRLFLFHVYCKPSFETTVPKQTRKSAILGWKVFQPTKRSHPLLYQCPNKDELNGTECQWQKHSCTSPGLISILIKFLPCPKPLNLFRLILISFQSPVLWIKANLAVWVLLPYAVFRLLLPVFWLYNSEISGPRSCISLIRFTLKYLWFK